MAPKKRRSVAKGKKSKGVPKVVEPETSVDIEKPASPVQASQTRVQPASTKQFGKFRCLTTIDPADLNAEPTTSTDSTNDDSNTCVTAQKNEPETPPEMDSAPTEAPEQQEEMSVNPVEEPMQEESQCPDSTKEVASESVLDDLKMENEDQVCESAEISKQFSSLVVSEETVIDSPSIIKEENEVVLECAAEEIVPNSEPVEEEQNAEETTESPTFEEKDVKEELKIEEVKEMPTEKVIEEMCTEQEPANEDSTVKTEDVMSIEPDLEKALQKVERGFKAKGRIIKPKAVKVIKGKAAKTKPQKKSPKIPLNKAKKGEKVSSDTSESSSTSESSIRRSSRIKCITVLKQRSKGYGLVKPKIPVPEASKAKPANDSDTSENSNSTPTESEKNSTDSPNFLTPSSHYDSDQKPVKVKSRWRRSSELEMNSAKNTLNSTNGEVNGSIEAVSFDETQTQIEKERREEVLKMRLKQFVHLKENQYLTDRVSCKEAKKMVCDCFLTQDEIDKGGYGCGDDCLNRLLMIECGPFCPVNDRCTNKRFQKAQFSPCEAFHTDKKGIGIRATANIPFGEFILEYIGEVIGPNEFEDRAAEYSKDKNPHYYFMSLRSDAVIDATQKGNISRFINHSCEPNAETQKWTVNGELRIGFFSKRTILAGEEITFDYQFQRYGKEAQKCLCETATCRGWLGEEPEDDDEDEEEEDEEEDEASEGKKQKELKDAKADDQENAVPLTEELKEEVESKAQIPKPKRKTVKKDKRKIKQKVRKEIFEDIDVNEEIDVLSTTGLKNQAHTLKLSRLMVRATEVGQRSRLLRILRHGEFPCRRLFLDYHGLRLIHGWMADSQQKCKSDEKHESLRLEMLQTLATLPIPNKTILQDSKVLPTVEYWSKKLELEISIESASNSPNAETVEKEEAQKPEEKEIETVAEPVSEAQSNSNVVQMEVEQENETVSDDDCDGIRKSVGMVNKLKSRWKATVTVQDITSLFDDDTDMASPCPFIDESVVEIKAEEKRDYEEEIMDLAVKLLEEWATLKEVFRIPKKERIEQMKEHEREADRGYKTGVDHDVNDKKRYSLQRYRERDMTLRRVSKVEDRFNVSFPKIDKHERRKLFALQQEDEDRRRKQREAWRQHEQYCYRMGMDPRLTAPYDPTTNSHCVWNPQIGQWQKFAMPYPPARFSTPMHYPSTPIMGNMLPGMINMPGIPPMQPQPTLSLPPNIQSALQNITIPANLSQITANISAMNSAQFVQKSLENDVEQVKFAGPIPPPVKLPIKWKTAKDKYGRPYYYHIKIRISQWEPPPLNDENDEECASDSSSSSETSSLSSESSTEDSEEDELDDTKLLLEIRKKFKMLDNPPPVTEEPEEPYKKLDENEERIIRDPQNENVSTPKSLDERLNEFFNVSKSEPHVVEPSPKKKRTGLVTGVRIISPRTDEDKQYAKENVRKYKENKERLRKQKEIQKEQAVQEQIKKRVKVTIKNQKNSKKHKSKSKEGMDLNSEAAKKIKEVFRTSMASVMVGILNPYRKPDCKEGRITNTEDFKHLARKLTHFVMLKELKHCKSIEDLTCTESVKLKAREFVRKYMSKYGEIYQKPADDLEY